MCSQLILYIHYNIYFVIIKWPYITHAIQSSTYEKFRAVKNRSPGLADESDLLLSRAISLYEDWMLPLPNLGKSSTMKNQKLVAS